MSRLAGQTVVVLGGSAGIGFATARLARDEGAHVIVTGRDAQRVDAAASELGAGGEAFDATDFDRLEQFFAELPEPVDHVLTTAGGPYYAPLPEIDFAAAQRMFDQHVWLPLRLARSAAPRMRPGGTILHLGGTGFGRVVVGLSVAGAAGAAMRALTASIALEIAPVRMNLIAAGFVDTGLSASLLGDDLDQRREQLRSELPIGRVVQPEDVAALALHLMANTAITGATYDIDGGQQLVTGL
jgi:NAD(P)-dependent dehydrogenase (short-subunit alcohol dehydrogenase family)